MTSIDTIRGVLEMTARSKTAAKDVTSVGVLLAALAFGYWDLRKEVNDLRDEVTALRISLIRMSPQQEMATGPDRLP